MKTRRNNSRLLLMGMVVGVLTLFGCARGLVVSERPSHCHMRPTNKHRFFYKPVPVRRSKSAYIHQLIALGRLNPAVYLGDSRLAPLPIEVVYLGHSRLIALPADKLFIGRSSNFTAGATQLLDAVVSYLRHDDMAVLEVTAYTDNTGYPKRDTIISRQRANNIVKYLTEKRIPANFIYAVGAGQKPIIARNYVSGGKRVNRRIEIRYQVLNDSGV